MGPGFRRDDIRIIGNGTGSNVTCNCLPYRERVVRTARTELAAPGLLRFARNDDEEIGKHSAHSVMARIELVMTDYGNSELVPEFIRTRINSPYCIFWALRPARRRQISSSCSSVL